MLSVVIAPSKAFDDGSISQWREDHEEVKIFDSIDDVKDFIESKSSDNSISLFPEITDSYYAEIVCEDNPSADEIRSLSSLCKNEDCLMILRKKHRANFSKDKYINLIDLTENDNVFHIIKKETSLSDNQIKKCMDASSSPLSALSIARQLSYAGGDDRFLRFTIDPFKKENLPWTLIDHIVAGRSDLAAKEAAILLISGEEPVGLCFQIAGYMQKIIMSPSKEAAETKWFKSQKIVNMFEQKAKRVNSASGLAHDIDYYPTSMLSAKKKFQKAIFVSMVVSIATRFGRR